MTSRSVAFASAPSLPAASPPLPSFAEPPPWRPPSESARAGWRSAGLPTPASCEPLSPSSPSTEVLDSSAGGAAGGGPSSSFDAPAPLPPASSCGVSTSSISPDPPPLRLLRGEAALPSGCSPATPSATASTKDPASCSDPRMNDCVFSTPASSADPTAATLALPVLRRAPPAPPTTGVAAGSAARKRRRVTATSARTRADCASSLQRSATVHGVSPGNSAACTRWQRTRQERPPCHRQSSAQWGVPTFSANPT